MKTVTCKPSSWIIAHFSLNSGIHLMSQEYTCFLEKSYANQTKFSVLPFLCKKVNRLKNELFLQFGYTYSQLQVQFVSRVGVISFTLSRITPGSPLSRVLYRDGYVISLSILHFISTITIHFIFYMKIRPYQQAQPLERPASIQPIHETQTLVNKDFFKKIIWFLPFK